MILMNCAHAIAETILLNSITEKQISAIENRTSKQALMVPMKAYSLFNESPRKLC